MKGKDITLGMFALSLCGFMAIKSGVAASIINNQLQQGEMQMTEERGLWQHTKEGTAKVWNKTKEVTGNMWKGTKEFTNDVWDETKEITGDVWNDTKEFTGGIWDDIKDISEDVKDAVTDEDLSDSTKLYNSEKSTEHTKQQKVSVEQNTASKPYMHHSAKDRGGPRRSNRHLQ